MKKIRIVNKTGIGRKTEVIDTETGKAIPNVKGMTIHISTDSIVTAELKFVVPEIDIMANMSCDGYLPAEEYYAKHVGCPNCGNEDCERTTGSIFESRSNPYRIKRVQNRVTCICGWIGIVHDLTDKREISKYDT